MKVLWFECTVPGRFRNDGAVLGGWQDSLENIVRDVSGVDLTIAFEVSKPETEKTIEGIRYIPIYPIYSKKELKESKKSWEAGSHKIVEASLAIVNKVKPDIIHIFGTEWAYGLIAEHTNIPTVIHIQGAIIPYNNADLPPRYSIWDIIRNEGLKRPFSMYKAWKKHLYEISHEDVEKRIWKAVPNYMGRTEWDRGLSAIMHPGRKYFHVEEALRPQFLDCPNAWHTPADGKIRLISTGIISFRKGTDMLLKVAEILSALGFNYEWHIAGILPPDFIKIVERKEGRSFQNSNIIAHGFVGAEEVFNLLSQSTLYIHTAYAENSPNSICEAQCLGIPVVSTNVGGISTLVHDCEDGILVPANDPWTMAYQIMELANDIPRMQTYSRKARERALTRHNPENIKTQLFYCYESIISKSV